MAVPLSFALMQVETIIVLNINAGIELYAVTLDCPGLEKLAEFYGTRLGRNVVYSDEAFSRVASGFALKIKN